jgi:zinc carboxypeptidase
MHEPEDLSATTNARGAARGPCPCHPARPTSWVSGVLPTWLEDETGTVPEYAAFAGADALERGLRETAASSGGAASYRRVGTSRGGTPIGCLSVGEGPADAVVVGLPHPNEPVGGLTALHLARRLVDDPTLRARLGHRWHIVACIDPDGLRLNEAWLAGPFTREHYLRHFYRPAGDEQVEWTFPVDHKRAYFDAVLPETLALMRLVDETRPALMGSLHNSELGGPYYYLTRPEPALHPVLQALPERFGIPLDRGEPESPTSTVYADGVFSGLRLADLYDAAEAAGDPLPLGAGDTSDSYAARHGTLTIVSEVPYWRDPRVGDTSPGATSYAKALTAQAEAVDEVGRLLVEGLARVERLLLVDSPFLRATRFFGPALVDGAAATRRRAAETPPERLATVAEEAGIDDVVHSFRLRFAGMFLRMLEAEAAAGNARPQVLAARDDLRERLEGWHAAAAAADRAEVIPIRSLVATQYGALLAGAHHLHHGTPG